MALDDLMKTSAGRVTVKAPPAGAPNKEFSSIWNRLFGRGVTDEEIASLSKFFTESDEDVALLQRLIETNKKFRPKPSEVPLFDNEALSIEKVGEGQFKGKSRWSPKRPSFPATQTFSRVQFNRNPFIDIDFPSANHPSAAVTAEGLEGAIDSLLKYQQKVRSTGLNPVGPVYLTPAGVHYIEQGFEMDPRQFIRSGFAKWSDPFYNKFSATPFPIEVAKHPSDFGVMAGGKEGFGRIEVDEFLRRRMPSDPGIMARRDVIGLLPPGFNIRTAPKRTQSGKLRIEDLPEGRVMDFVKMRLGTLGSGTPTASGAAAVKIHDAEVLKELEALQDLDPRIADAMRVSRSRSAGRVEDLPKKLKKILRVNPQTMSKAIRGGIPLMALLALAGIIGTSLTSDEA